MNHAETIQQIYAAFGRGDIPSILNHLSEDVDWEYGTTPSSIPWLQPRKGREGAAKFFETLSALEIHRFQPKTILANDHLVVALFDLEATVKATGKRIVEEDEVHIW